MIDPLKSDEIIRQVGGRFKLTSLVQHRWRELMDGARPLVERQGRSDLEVAIQEIVEQKIAIDYESSDLVPPEESQKQR
jgi:DNA-directed RNA polymerase subunit omega